MRIDLIVDSINDQRDGHLQCLATLHGGRDAFVEFLGLSDRDSHAVVARRTPAVGRVRFANVNRIEVGSIFESSIDLVEDSRLESKRASGETTEDQHDRALAARVGQLDELVGQHQFRFFGVVG